MKIIRYKYECCSNESESDIRHYALKEQEIEFPNFDAVDNLQQKHEEFFKNSLQKVYEFKRLLISEFEKLESMPHTNKEIADEQRKYLLDSFNTIESYFMATSIKMYCDIKK